MRIIVKRAILSVVVIFLIVFICGFVFVLVAGKALLQSQLAQALKKEVRFSTVRLSPFGTLEIRDLEIPNFATIDKVSISPLIIGFAKKRAVLGRVGFSRPRISIHRLSDGSWDLPPVIQEQMRNQGAKSQPPVLISGLAVNDGSVTFSDETKTPAFNFGVKNLNLDVGNKILSFNPILTRFRVKGEVVTKPDKPVSVFAAEGWVDFLRKDMKGMVNLSDLDAVYFLPLYSKYMTSNLRNAILSFKSDLVAHSNDLIANCHLGIRDLVFEKAKDETAPTISFLDIVTGGLQTENKEVNVDFVIKTKLDNPRVDVVKLSGNIMAKALGDQLMQAPPQETIDNFKSLGKEFEKIGKNILKEKLGIDLSKKKKGEVNAPASPEQSQPPEQQNAVVP
jgi:ABC-type antimicrobial peptide transport system permease subunit